MALDVPSSRRGEKVSFGIGVLTGVGLMFILWILSMAGYYYLVKQPFQNATVEDFLPKPEGTDG